MDAFIMHSLLGQTIITDKKNGKEIIILKFLKYIYITSSKLLSNLHDNKMKIRKIKQIIMNISLRIKE